MSLNFSFSAIKQTLINKHRSLREFILVKTDRHIYLNLLLLLVIAVIPSISQESVNKQVYRQIASFTDPLDPIKAGELTDKVAPLTPGIIERGEDVTLSLMTKNESYTLAQQLALNEGRATDQPTRQEATYTVRSGETLTQIAEKFDLHVQSIIDANNINPEDAKKIKEGVVLRIPSSDTSTSTDWLVAINKAEEEAKRRAAEEARKKEAAKKKIASKSLGTSQKTASGFSGVDSSDIIVPISGHKGISQHFTRGHTGIDYMATTGTPIYASASGKVVIISGGWSGGYGTQIVIDHGGGRATRYAHLNSVDVSIGETVSKGQLIARSGNTGRSTGPHLHWELIINGRPVNPPH